MIRSIFISRDLPENSALLLFLKEQGCIVHHSSLIEIEPLPFSIEKDFDWIFLSSTNGAKILFNSYQPKVSTKIGVVGSATATAVRAFGIYPDLIGDTGNMDQLADQLARTVGSDSVLFAGAAGGSEKVRASIPLENQEFVALYRTVAKKLESIPETDLVFLSSPSNAKAYLALHSLNGKTVIAIGNTTAEYLHKCNIAPVLVPRSPKESDVINLLKSL